MRSTLFLLMLTAMPVWADEDTFVLDSIELLTSITDVYGLGTDQVTGSITLRMTDDRFSRASLERPIYIRFSLDSATVLSRTIVDPSGLFTVEGDRALNDVPVDLHLDVLSIDQSVRIAADLPEYAVQLIRAVEGEQDIWLRISVPTSRWLDTDNDGLGDAAPDCENPVSFSIALDAGLGNNRRGESGFAFETIEEADTYANFGEDSERADTRFFIDYHRNGCAMIPDFGLHLFDVLSWDSTRAPGDTGTVEAHAAVPVDPNCLVNHVDSRLYLFRPDNYRGDFTIARVIPESSLQARLFAPETVIAGEPVDMVNRVIGDAFQLQVSWHLGIDMVTTSDTHLRYIFDKPGPVEIITEATNGNGASAVSSAVVNVVTPESVFGGNQIHLRDKDGDETELYWDLDNGNEQVRRYEIYQMHIGHDEEFKLLAFSRSQSYATYFVRLPVFCNCVPRNWERIRNC